MVPADTAEEGERSPTTGPWEGGGGGACMSPRHRQWHWDVRDGLFRGGLGCRAIQGPSVWTWVG